MKPRCQGPADKVVRKTPDRAKSCGGQIIKARAGQIRCTAQIKYPGRGTRIRKSNLSTPLVFPADPADFSSSEFFRPAHIFDVAPVPHPLFISSSCCLACSHSRALTHLRTHSCHPFPHSLTYGRFSLSDLFSLGSRPDRPAHCRHLTNRTGDQPAPRVGRQDASG